MSGYKDINAEMGVQVWNLKAGQEGEPFRLTKQWAKSVSVHGTFGLRGTVQILGTLDPGDNPFWFYLTDKHGRSLTIESPELHSISECCYAIMPHVPYGDETTDLTVILLVETEA